MITVKLMGGLGNQMFQRAYGLALSRAGYNVAFNRTALVQPGREYALDEFESLPLVVNDEPAIHEQGISFQTSLLSPRDGSVMVGYWQSEKYFSHVADDVRKAFQFRIAMPRYRDAIAVHVRRGDYLDLQHFHGMPSREWYIGAVSAIRLRHGAHLSVIVVSDDPQWCRAYLPEDWHIAGGIPNKYRDMQIIASCAHSVISNSSFSWWGAWLGDGDPQRMVIAPTHWYANPTMQDDRDVVPERWIRL